VIVVFSLDTPILSIIEGSIAREGLGPNKESSVSLQVFEVDGETITDLMKKGAAQQFLSESAEHGFWIKVIEIQHLRKLLVLAICTVSTCS